MRWLRLAACLVLPPAVAACASLYSGADGQDAGSAVGDAAVDATGISADGQPIATIDPTEDGSAPVDASAPDAHDAGPTSCAALRALTGATMDGKYTIDPDGDGPQKPFQVFCYEMADPSKTPLEYLSLPISNGSNTSRFAVGGYCTGCAGDFVRQFTRVRLRLSDFTVLTNDLQYATPLAACGTSFCQGTGLEWGMAGSCVTNNDSSGTANVDLTGTPFHIAAQTSFVQEGAMPAGNATISTDRKTATITGGGACGWTQAAPANGNLLRLEQD